VVVHAFVGSDPAAALSQQVLEADRVLSAPQILKAEAVSALRGLLLRGVISEPAARRAVDRVRRIDTASHPIEPLLSRVWELRDNLTVYDGWYVALAERLDVPLYTTDGRLAAAPGPQCEIIVTA